MLDVVAIVGSFVGSFVLRFDYPSAQFAQYFGAYAWVLVPLIVARTVAFASLRLYQRVWRYASVGELVAVLVAVLASSAVVYAGVFAAGSGLVESLTFPFPRSIPIIDSLLTVAFAGAWRFTLRIAQVGRAGARAQYGVERALIVGSGAAAIAVIRELRGNRELPFHAVGVLTTEHEKGQRLMGLPILGTPEGLAAAIQEHAASVVLLALPTADGKTIRGFVRAAEKAGARCLTVPSVAEVVSGRVSLNTLRDVDLEDLLRRAPARIDLDSVSSEFAGRSVLVTGAGGSIGSELARQVARIGPQRLLLLGRGENSIFEAMQTMPAPGPASEVRPVILDVRDGARLDALFGADRPDVVFHAAAHKHVPLMELYPEAAVETNVLGTVALLEACIHNDVERFVFISTDKAVNPRSVMGATKRVAELLVLQAARRTGRRYASVRFGNVLSSRGSVVPVFRRELEQGRPLTITHPDVARFFMTIPEAVQLVLQASVFAEPGDTFVLDMGEPVRILDLASDLAALHGLELGKDVPVNFTGLRPGEKLHEELFFSWEEPLPTTHEAIRRVRSGGRASSDLDASVERLRALLARPSRVEIIDELVRIVPEYRPSPDPAATASDTPGPLREQR